MLWNRNILWIVDQNNTFIYMDQKKICVVEGHGKPNGIIFALNFQILR